MQTKGRVVVNKANESDLLEEELIKTPDSFFLELEILDILEVSSLDDIFNIVLNKVRIKGKIKISGFDGYELCSEVTKGRIQLSELNPIFKNIQRFFSLIDLRSELEKRNWKILFAGINGYNRYLIEAERQ